MKKVQTKQVYVSPAYRTISLDCKKLIAVSGGSPDIFDNDNGDEDEVWS